jgi:hypothetical protein
MKWATFTITRCRLDPDHSAIMEFLKILRSGISTGGTKPGHDLIDQIFNARALGIKEHLGVRDPLFEESLHRLIE